MRTKTKEVLVVAKSSGIGVAELWQKVGADYPKFRGLSSRACFNICWLTKLRFLRARRIDVGVGTHMQEAGAKFLEVFHFGGLSAKRAESEKATTWRPVYVSLFGCGHQSQLQR